MTINSQRDAPSPPPLVLTAPDFASNATAIASRLGFSFQFPTEGVPVPTTQAPRPGPTTLSEGVHVPTTQALSTNASSSVATLVPLEDGRDHATHEPIPGSSPVAEGMPVTTSRVIAAAVCRLPRPCRRSRWDVKGRCFYMCRGDVLELWPRWRYCNRKRVPWTVVDYVGTTDRLTCRYAGTNVFNRELIGNDGVTEFAQTHRFLSGETLVDLLPSEPRYPYHQIGAKQFRCYDRRDSPAMGPGIMASRFTEQSRCPHCRTPLFERELSAMCCSNGKFVLPRGRPNPHELEQLLNNREFPKCASR